jgi:hypothetical protein
MMKKGTRRGGIRAMEVEALSDGRRRQRTKGKATISQGNEDDNKDNDNNDDNNNDDNKDSNDRDDNDNNNDDDKQRRQG